MSSIRTDIISIGTLSRNRLWKETDAVRTAHATTTLIRSGERHLIIDPGLPPQALAARLFERTGLTADKIDLVFLTNFRPSHRRGLSLFTHAKLLINELEQQAIRQHLERLADEAPEEDEDRKLIFEDLELLETFQPADDKLAAHVELFPLLGYTPGNCGVIVTQPTITTLIAGDAIPTLDHFLAGQVLPDSYDIKQALESMREVYEIADLIVPGHDNIFLNPRSQGI